MTKSYFSEETKMDKIKSDYKKKSSFKKITDTNAFASFEEHVQVLNATKKLLTPLNDLSLEIIDCYKNGKKVICAGNGGSAAEAEHLVAELVGRFMKERRPLEAYSLTTNSSIVTAIANDYGYDKLFHRQLEAMAKKDDIVIFFSTSGNSKNIVQAIEVAKKNGAKVAAFLGKDGGEMKGMCDFELIVPSNSTPRIQEMHILMVHELCEKIDSYVN